MTRRFFALAAALPLLLAGCGGDDDPQPKMPETQAASATPTPSASPTGPVEPTPPPELDGRGKTAALALVKHYFAMVNYAQATGDTSGLAELALETCVSCSGGLKGIKETVAGGGRIEGGIHTVENARASGLSSNSPKESIFTVRTNVKHTQETRVRTAGGRPEVYPAGKDVWVLTVLMDDRGWHVSDWDIVQ